ncbi:MAG: lysozyme, partial [Lachnospiraceae bacterium]|nr:lysozyme [Lachnospiraceae bacterium]
MTTGIDVSYYQGNINWSKVKAAGVKFAIIRCGYSTLAKGEKNRDVKF